MSAVSNVGSSRQRKVDPGTGLSKRGASRAGVLCAGSTVAKALVVVVSAAAAAEGAADAVVIEADPTADVTGMATDTGLADEVTEDFDFSKSSSSSSSDSLMESGSSLLPGIENGDFSFLFIFYNEEQSY